MNIRIICFFSVFGICIVFKSHSQGCTTVAPTSADISALQNSSGRTIPTGQDILYIKTAVHMIYEFSPTEHISPDELHDVLIDVNNEFLPSNIQFLFCVVQYVPEGSTGNQVDGYLNVWVEASTAQYSGGFARYLRGINPITDPDLASATVISSTSLNFPSVLKHELGHNLGLLHTHGSSQTFCSSNELVNGSNCDSSGDYICDTPADPNINWNENAFCNYSGPNCFDGNGHLMVPDPTNIMSYGLICPDHFSTGQMEAVNFYVHNYVNSIFTTTETDLGSVSYSTNSSVNGELLYYSSLTVNGGAELDISSCSVEIDDLNITSGSSLLID